jgi:hypothetical protein
MARIRSTHPGQWNDDDFLDCSPFARLLALAIRNFADDNGVFEWKPKQIKRNCLPADACDVAPLLKELTEHNQVRPFTVDGKEYGAIRNFRPWQRPKTPKSIYPCPDEIRKYVGLTSSNLGNSKASDRETSEIDDDDNNTISAAVRKLPEQRKEEGGSKYNSEAKASAADAASNEPDKAAPSGPIDDRTWLFHDGLAYLQQTTGRAEGGLRSQLGRWLRDTTDDASIIRSVIEEAITQNVAEPLSWLTKTIPVRAKKQTANLHPVDAEREGWRNKVRAYRDRGIWLLDWGPKPDEASCEAPQDVLDEFGYEPVLPASLKRTQAASGGRG